jgi:hypothetical protein
VPGEALPGGQRRLPAPARPDSPRARDVSWVRELLQAGAAQPVTGGDGGGICLYQLDQTGPGDLRGDERNRCLSGARGRRRRLELDLLLRDAARPAEEQERQRRADPGEESAGEEGGLEALGQRDERVGAFVRR